MSYEDQVRREMEAAAAQQQVCPAEDDIDGAFSMIREKVHSYKGPAMKAGKKAMGAALRKPSKATKIKEHQTSRIANDAREAHHKKHHGY